MYVLWLGYESCRSVLLREKGIYCNAGCALLCRREFPLLCENVRVRFACAPTASFALTRTPTQEVISRLIIYKVFVACISLTYHSCASVLKLQMRGLVTMLCVGVNAITLVCQTTLVVDLRTRLITKINYNVNGRNHNKWSPPEAYTEFTRCMILSHMHAR